MDQQTWTTLVGLAGFSLAMITYLTAMKRDLKAEIGSSRAELKADIGSSRAELKADIGSLRTELKTEIADTRTELKADIASVRDDLKAEIARVEIRLISLENRTYDISTRLPAAPSAS
ncbi:hypothetical protein [Aeromicrobium sp. P5_D10]